MVNTGKVITYNKRGEKIPFDPWRTIKGIHWDDKKGIVYLVFEYQAAKASSSPAVASATLSDLPWGTTYALETNITESDPAIIGMGAIPVENPVTNDMLTLYRQWTPHVGWVETKTIPGDDTTFYIPNGAGGAFTQDNWNTPYPATDQCGVDLTYGGAFGSTYFNCNPVAVAEAQGNGFTARPIIYNANLFGTMEDAQYYCDAVNSLDFFTGNGFTCFVTAIEGSSPDAHVKNARYVASINVAKLRAASREGHTGGPTDPFPTTIAFNINVTGTTDSTWKVRGAAYKSLRDFQLDAKNVPQFTPFPQATKTGAANESKTIVATLDLDEVTLTFSDGIG